MREDLQNLPITIEIYRTYEQDRLTKRVKRLISEMSVSEISREFKLPTAKSELIKARVSEVFLLSNLVTFKKLSIRLVQMLYDFGFNKSANSKLATIARVE